MNHHSPIRNPIERFLPELKTDIHKRIRLKLNNLERFCIEQWSRLPVEIRKSLQKSFVVIVCLYVCSYLILFM